VARTEFWIRERLEKRGPTDRIPVIPGVADWQAIVEVGGTVCHSSPASLGATGLVRRPSPSALPVRSRNHPASQPMERRFPEEEHLRDTLRLDVYKCANAARARHAAQSPREPAPDGPAPPKATASRSRGAARLPLLSCSHSPAALRVRGGEDGEEVQA
jgi:hypothetical protein